MAESNQLYDFGRVQHQGQFCKIIVHFEPLVQKEKPFKDISYLELLRSIVQWSGTICAKLAEDTTGDSSVK